MNELTDEEILTNQVSDEALEAAGAAMPGRAVTLIQGSYCFTCAQEVQWVITFYCACGTCPGLKTSRLRRKKSGSASRASTIRITPNKIAPTPNTSGAPTPWIAVLPWLGSL